MAIEIATLDDVDKMKSLIEECHYEKGYELGFISRGALETFVRKGRAIVYKRETILLGVLLYYDRRDAQVTLHYIAVLPHARLQGIGRRMVSYLASISKLSGKEFLISKSPTDLPANNFYERTGWELIGREQGKKRLLNVWNLDLMRVPASDLIQPDVRGELF